ncbi:MAG: GNAT family N-acetyltransferase [Lachnospiraceae bacterium]|nr:GNAT family N-acetyltransferase [Lachnospiraceae bacterium]
MEYRFEKRLCEGYAEEVRRILYKADGEFVPALSSRNGTTQKNLSGGATATADPVEYFEVMRQQAFVLALEGEKVVGFLSFIPHHRIEMAGEKVVCAYVSTIVVDPAYRGKGLTEGMYEKLFDEIEDNCVATRTWSKNHAHIHILEKEHFRLADTLKDDRGLGIDTVYYVKELP